MSLLQQWYIISSIKLFNRYRNRSSGRWPHLSEVRPLEDSKAMTQTQVPRNPKPILFELLELFMLSNCKDITKVPELPGQSQRKRNGIKWNCLASVVWLLYHPFFLLPKWIPILLNYPSISHITHVTQRSLPISNSEHRFWLVKNKSMNSIFLVTNDHRLGI